MSSLDNRQRIALAAVRALALGEGDLDRIEPDALVACHQRPRADERQLELLAGYTLNAIPLRGRRFGTGRREHPRCRDEHDSQCGDGYCEGARNTVTDASAGKAP
jgi:hypothetical protein